MIPNGSVVDVHAHVFPHAALAASGSAGPGSMRSSTGKNSRRS